MSKLPSEVLSLDVYFKNGIETCSVDYFGYVLILFDSYTKHGLLPYAGCLSDQPNKIIEIFQVLEQLTLEREQSFREKQEKENAKNNRKTR